MQKLKFRMHLPSNYGFLQGKKQVLRKSDNLFIEQAFLPEKQ